ncbi:hypothetical protein ACOXXX_08950 [Thalassococcus sp. BH17M4-6]|uniref:hypothetical protein n=1 Tax=Thalassococcus sp. BH17M4-6 TaxID=3413148 RepID=UPI003BEDCB37
MTTFAASFFSLFAPVPKTADKVRPPRPSAGPVLIQDSITAANHTTLLYELWRRSDDAKAANLTPPDQRRP